MDEVSIIPMMAASPCTHMGHIIDLGSLLMRFPGSKIIGLSAKQNFLSAERRIEILRRQIGSEPKIMVVSTVGETIRAAAAVKAPVLNIIVGRDRKIFGDEIKSSILKGGHGLERETFSEVRVHMPETERHHSLSGTAFRQAANDIDLPIFRAHLGPMFEPVESASLMFEICFGILTGALRIKRR